MDEKKNLLKIFEKTKKALEAKDVFELEKLSNETIHVSSMIQNPEIILSAVLIYSFGKILGRESYKNYEGWSDFYNLVEAKIDKIILDLQKDDFEAFKIDLESIRDSVKKLSGKLKFYIQEVFKRSKVNKASRIYEHGISMETTARLLGVTMFELAEYSGRGRLSDSPEGKTLDVKERVKIAEDIFND